MAFDVSKFLALTALIASTGAACSGTDSDEEPSKGGSSGSGTSGDAGQSTQGGGNDGVGGAAAGNGGDAGNLGGAAGGVGGESLGGTEAGGAAGAGGSADFGECLGELAEGGAAGAPAVDPSLEGLCSDYFSTICPGSEEDAPSYTVCAGVRDRAQPGVAVAVADCISKLSATDACDYAKVTACLTGLAGKGCANADSATACATIKTNCDAVDVASCEKIADLVKPEQIEGFTGCMDPTDEGWYEEAFTGTCVERLDFCAGARNFYQF